MIYFFWDHARRREPLDRWLGDLGYPVFITHFLAGGIVRIVFGGDVQPLGLEYLFLSLVVCLAISIVFVHFVQRPLEHLRDRVRHKRAGDFVLAGSQPLAASRDASQP